jgi:hypothetical protein
MMHINAVMLHIIYIMLYFIYFIMHINFIFILLYVNFIIRINFFCRAHYFGFNYVACLSQSELRRVFISIVDFHMFQIMHVDYVTLRGHALIFKFINL